MNIQKSIHLILFIMLFLGTVHSQSVEYTVKAMYIEKFARFTDWQTELKGEYFVIYVLGESPFKGELEKLAKKIIIKGKQLKINYIKNTEDIKDCNLLFICSSEKNKLAEIMKSVDLKSILTIADSPGYCKKGVHFNFFIDDSDVIKFEVNPNTLKKAKLNTDIQLLNFGEIVN